MSPHNSETQYTHGYTNPAFAGIASRTAANHAYFLLPHLKSGDTLLDIGCGPGTITLGLAEAVAPGRASEVDIGEEFIELARDGAESAGVQNVNFATGDALKLDFDDESFDAVFACALLEHLPEPIDAMKEWKRVLKPGGVVAVVSGAVSRHAYAPDSPWRNVGFYLAVWEQNGGHPEIGLTQPKLLEDAGFSEIEVGGFITSLDALAQVAWAERMREPSFITQAVEGGFATEEEIEDLATEIEAWAKLENSWYLLPWFYGLGKKPAE